MISGLFGADKIRVTEMIASTRSGYTGKIMQFLAKGANINAPEPDTTGGLDNG
jgi:hypothetical protein